MGRRWLHAALAAALACSDESARHAAHTGTLMHARAGTAAPSAMLADLAPERAPERVATPNDGRRRLPTEAVLNRGGQPPSMMLEDLAVPASRSAPLEHYPIPLPEEP